MRNKKLLFWLPVLLLSSSNLIVAWVTHESLTVSVAWIIGAAAEELFFRFFLLKTIFFRTIKPTIAIILVSILFAGMHLFNLQTGQPIDQTLVQVMCAFCFSIWAGAVTWKSTFLIPLLAHVLVNVTVGEEIMWVSLAVSSVVLVDGIVLIFAKEGDLK